jgi:hypothetical protein
MKKRILFLALFGSSVLAVMIARNGAPLSSPASASSGVLEGASGTKHEGATPVIVELFTSEGCSSCPPADDVIASLAKTQPVPGAEIIALGEHVDYWNRLGWTDPFSSSEFSRRQREYSSAFASDEVYTPQMIVDGEAEFVGSNMAKARAAIAHAASLPKATVEIGRAENQGSAKRGANSLKLAVSVNHLPAAKPGDTADVMLALTQDGLSSNVARGENGGRRLIHDAVVRQLSVIGRINLEEGGSFSAAPVINIPGDWNRKSVHVVVFVQERSSRRVLGAASTNLAAE